MFLFLIELFLLQTFRKNKDVKYSTTKYLCKAVEGHWTLVEYYARSCLALREQKAKEDEHKSQTLLLAYHMKNCNLSEEEGKISPFTAISRYLISICS